jgi:hypothetical protein
LILAAACLSGCATARIETASLGAGPSPDASNYAFAPAAGAADQALQPLVEAQLRARGLVRTGEPDARYIVEVAYDERPLPVGAYAVAPPSGKSDQTDWLAKPERRSWWVSERARVCAISIRFSEAGAGREVYRVGAAERRSNADCAAVASSLIGAALVQIPLPPPRRARG